MTIEQYIKRRIDVLHNLPSHYGKWQVIIELEILALMLHETGYQELCISIRQEIEQAQNALYAEQLQRLEKSSTPSVV